ncbi:MAG: type 4a pilus biogenesis protein PilO [bacterium]|jgi:Tfp pilus assembly protein PilO|nr:type 4a pilus biogenesis protein PilO [bacterium]MDD4153140.1 type 4a pilus biogenesis protein PilO [bacterium]
MIDILKRRPSFTVIIFMGLLVAAMFIGIIGQRISLLHVTKELGFSRKESSDTVRRLQALRLNADEYADLSSSLGITKAGAPASEDDVSTVIERVTAIIESQGCVVTRLRPEQATVKDGISRLPVKISLECNLDDLTRILFKMERGKHLFAIEKMDIRLSNDYDKGTPELLKVEMTAASFSLKQSKNNLVNKGDGER